MTFFLNFSDAFINLNFRALNWLFWGRLPTVYIVWRCQTLGHGRNCFLFSFAVHTVLSTPLLVKITFIRKFLFPWSLICNFICFVFKKPECQWTYFDKQVLIFFSAFQIIYLTDSLVFSNTFASIRWGRDLLGL